MRIMVEILTTALATSKTVPPTEPVMMLLANQSRVLANNTERKGTPRMVKMATVAMQDPITGNQPAAFRARAAPMPRLRTTKAAPSHKDR